MLKKDTKIHDLKSLRDALPLTMADEVSENLLEAIQNIPIKSGVYEEYAEEVFFTNLHTYEEISKIVRGLTLVKYADAVTFVINKLHTPSTVEAWRKTFPQRYQALLDSGQEYRNGSPNSVYSQQLASSYNRSKLVVEIETNMMLGAHIQYQGLRHEAIMKQFELMNGRAAKVDHVMYIKEGGKYVLDEYGRKQPHRFPNGEIVTESTSAAVSPVVQQLASAKLIELTEAPTTTKIDVTVGVSDKLADAQFATANALLKLAEEQHKLLTDGKDIDTVQQIGHVIDTSIEEPE